MFMKIYSVENEELTVHPEDFAKIFVARQFGGVKATFSYTALRACGIDRFDAFASSFGQHCFGHPDAVNAAAAAFESSDAWRSLQENVAEAIGWKNIRKALRERCSISVPAYVQNIAMALNAEVMGRIVKECAPLALQSAARDEGQFEKFLKDRAASANAQHLDGWFVRQSV